MAGGVAVSNLIVWCYGYRVGFLSLSLSIWVLFGKGLVEGMGWGLGCIIFVDVEVAGTVAFLVYGVEQSWAGCGTKLVLR